MENINSCFIKRYTYKDDSDYMSDYYCKYFINNNKREGEFIEYYMNNTIRSTYNYINGKIHGTYIMYFYDDNDDVDVDVDVDNNVDGNVNNNCGACGKNTGIFLRCNVIHGNISGLYTEFYSNGNICKEKNYINGKLDGVCKEYDRNGNIHKVTNYINGKLDETN